MQLAARATAQDPPVAAFGQRSEATAPAATAHVALLSDRWLNQPEWAKYDLQVVRLGPVAFERLVQDPPDAFVLDLALADARQLDTCWQLHDLLRVPLVLVAPETGAAGVAALLDRGADEVIAGSVDGPLLAARVGAILRRTLAGRPVDAPARVRLGDVTVDLASRTVQRAGETTVLSRTEFQLFQALVAARGRVCGNAELAGRVWGAHQPSAARYLRLYIRYLRQKLEVDPASPRYLLNIWGRGYQLLLDVPELEESGPAPRSGKRQPARAGARSPRSTSGDAAARAIRKEA